MTGRDMDCRTQLATLANEELDKGDFLMATKMLNTGIRLEPNNHELYFERSICHHKLGDYKASLDDANAAIRLNSNDYSIHYQKGLALIGLSMFSDALTSFKKAIELRARQDDSKLSDLWKLLKDCSSEMKNARSDRSGMTNLQARSETVPTPTNQAAMVLSQGQGSSSDPVDSTTDRPNIHQPSTSNQHHNLSSMEGLTKNGNNNLVANNRNNQSMPNSSLIIGRVSSSASHTNNNHYATPCVSSVRVDAQNMGADLLNQTNGSTDQSKSAQFEWNIRRSERIFLHHTGVPEPAESQYEFMTNFEAPQNPIANSQRQRINSPSINSSVRSAIKQLHDSELQTYQPSKVTVTKDGASNSQIESDVDVDDSCNDRPLQIVSDINDPVTGRKKVITNPGTSNSATNQGQASSSTSKDDSYSSKYKRLRRDRERARRGTSKLCTIKPSDLEELQKSTSDSEQRYMRVIAPIRGWLYSGQLSVNHNTRHGSSTPHYVVKLDATGTTCDFDTNTVLNKVIKEVRVKSVSELRKGARICCYWSRQYKCLSTGVVTSRTFEETKSLVSVKYDNGDLSALPLEDLRLLPPDYPKCMSNCDPHLFTENGDELHANTSSTSGISNNSNHTRVVADTEPTPDAETRGTNGLISFANASTTGAERAEVNVEEFLDNVVPKVESPKRIYEEGEEVMDEDEEDEDDDDATIPPTDETVDFITSETTLKQQDENQHNRDELERVPATKDNIAITNETQLNVNASRASSEENNYGVEYCPWSFDGPPKRSKRHGRFYRENYSSIRRGNEVISIGDSAELMPRPDESILPFVAKIEGFWATGRGEMRVRVRWYYRLVETEGEPYKLPDGENALFETDHFDENDVQSIYRSTRILSWTDYKRDCLGHVNKNNNETPKTFYLAGSYDPVRRVKRLESDVKVAQ